MAEPHDTALVRAQIEQLLSLTYAWTDFRQSHRFDEILDDTFEIVTPEGTMDRAEYVRRQTDREHAPYDTRHVWSNLQVSVDGDVAHVRFYQCAHIRQPRERTAVAAMADVVDRWVRRPDGWRLASRVRTPSFG